MTRRKTLVILLVIAGVLAGLLAWRLVAGGGGGTPEVDDTTREAMVQTGRISTEDPGLAAYLEAHDVDSLSEQELAELILEYQRQRDAASPETEQGSALEPVEG